jgi:hypothetical protein
VDDELHNNILLHDGTLRHSFLDRQTDFEPTGVRLSPDETCIDKLNLIREPRNLSQTD